MQAPILKLFDSLSGTVKVFVPKNKQHVGMYVCGPTAYTRPHIGNMRSALIYDTLFRILKLIYHKVTYVRNITDIDDKIINSAHTLKSSVQEVVSKSINYFHQDLNYLNCLDATIEPRVTNCMPEIINMIQDLINYKHGYIQNNTDNDVMFSVKSYKKYGQLARRDIDMQISGARVNIDVNKIDAHDFVLWKTTDEPNWHSPFGKGRPGWHIECSAMSNKYLRDDNNDDIFDIHGGGVDLKFPHHENELAQSCCARAITPNYWIHNGFLTVNGEKMSKSIENTVNICDLENDGFTGEVVRLALLSTHYRKPINITTSLLQNSQLSLRKFYQVFYNNADLLEISNNNTSLQLSDIPAMAQDCLLDDINLSKYIALMFSYFKDIRDTRDIKSRGKLLNILYKMGHIIGLFANITSKFDCDNKLNLLDTIKQYEDVPAEVVNLIKNREMHRNAKNFAVADSMRKHIYDLGFIVADRSDGLTSVTKRERDK